MSEFQLVTRFQPAGDQPEAIRQMVEGLEAGLSHQTLLGVTGSGKTFSIANVIAKVQRPTLVLAPNKTLAAQLYGEFKSFFPNNAVEYFVSYYDYYQPEAYVPASDTYIEKDSSINDHIGNGKRLARSRYAEQCLVRKARLQALDHLPNSLRLIAGWLETGDQLKLGHDGPRQAVVTRPESLRHNR